MWTFVYKEVALCACAAAKQTRRNATRILMFFTVFGGFLMFYKAFDVMCFCCRVVLLGQVLLLGHIRYLDFIWQKVKQSAKAPGSLFFFKVILLQH